MPLDPIPSLCPPSPLLLTTRTPPSCCRPAKWTLFDKVPRSSPPLFPSAPVQWPASGSYVATVLHRSPSSCLRVASCSTVALLSPCSGTAWRAAGWCRPHTRAILSDEVLPRGQQPMGLMPTQSAPWAAGAVIVSDATLIGLQQSVPPPPGQPSTQTPLLSYTSKSQPGEICNPTASLGSPASTPQPQLATVPPYGMPLAYSVATAGSPPATLPRVRQSHISHVPVPRVVRAPGSQTLMTSPHNVWKSVGCKRHMQGDTVPRRGWEPYNGLQTHHDILCRNHQPTQNGSLMSLLAAKSLTSLCPAERTYLVLSACLFCGIARRLVESLFQAHDDTWPAMLPSIPPTTSEQRSALRHRRSELCA